MKLLRNTTIGMISILLFLFWLWLMEITGGAQMDIPS